MPWVWAQRVRPAGPRADPRRTHPGEINPTRLDTSTRRLRWGSCNAGAVVFVIETPAGSRLEVQITARFSQRGFRSSFARRLAHGPNRRDVHHMAGSCGMAHATKIGAGIHDSSAEISRTTSASGRERRLRSHRKHREGPRPKRHGGGRLRTSVRSRVTERSDESPSIFRPKRGRPSPKMDGVQGRRPGRCALATKECPVTERANPIERSTLHRRSEERMLLSRLAVGLIFEPPTRLIFPGSRRDRDISRFLIRDARANGAGSR